MLPPTVIRQIELLLEEGQLSRRKIAETVGVARGTVTAVAVGRRQTEDYLEQIPAHRPVGKMRRCPKCRATVQMPCRLCQTRELMATRQLRPPKPVLETPIGLDLKPEDQARYAEVRRWRREAARLGVIANGFGSTLNIHLETD